ncbi:MAG: SUMF1/EgtB/PvdO family nonheme iron enzyme [Candidatus Sumerlaeota bacterium]|nr:SUMF1/EgtB/PvdO family nonheme iron enzyme [Candidatus Sumerlaeota bacterium]
MPDPKKSPPKPANQSQNQPLADLQISSFSDIGQANTLSPHSIGEEDTLQPQSGADARLGQAPEGVSSTIDGGRLRIVEKLGEGGMGVVWKAQDERIGRLVAVKRPKGALLSTTKGRARFLREARAAAALSHPNIVMIHYFGEDARGPFIEMEYIEGQSLRDFVKQARASGYLLPDGSKWDWRRVTEIFIKVCDALAMAHERGVIHRDIKPANILLNQRLIPKLLDFGLAAVEESEDGDRVSMTSTGAMMGSFLYASPEQLSNAKNANARSDIYSLGATLYYALSGREPRSLEWDLLPVPLAHVVRKAMSESPAARYDSVRALEEALRAALEAGEIAEGVCPKCRKESPLTARHCVHCGASLASMFEPCPKCKVENRRDQEFCQGCGVSLAGLRELARLRSDLEYAERIHDYEEMRRLARAALEMEPDDKQYFATRLRKASEALENIRELESRLKSASLTPSEKIAILAQMLALSPGKAEWRQAHHKAEEELERWKAEQERIQQIQNIETLRRQIEALPEERYDERIALLERYAALAPSEPAIPDQIASIRHQKLQAEIDRLQQAARGHVEREEYDEALRLLNQARELAPQSDALERAIQRVEETRAERLRQRAELEAATARMMAEGAYAGAARAIRESPFAAEPEFKTLLQEAGQKEKKLAGLIERIGPLRERRAYEELAQVLQELKALNASLPEAAALANEIQSAHETIERSRQMAAMEYAARRYVKAAAWCDTGLKVSPDDIELLGLRERSLEAPRLIRRRRLIMAAVGVVAVLLAAIFISVQIARWNDSRAWDLAVAKGHIADYENYLSRHSEGARAAEARTTVGKLRKAEEEAWNKAQRRDTADAYAEYLKAYPEGANEAQAREKLASLESQNWETAGKLATLDGYQAYLRAYPKGPHVLDALQGIAKIEEGEWAKTKQLDQVEGYRAFIAKFPEGKFAPEAKTTLAATEEKLWREAQAGKRVEGYMEYLKRFPEGGNVTAARQALKNMEESAWSEAQKADTAESYAAYLQALPQGAHAADAAKRSDFLSKINAARAAIEAKDWSAAEKALKEAAALAPGDLKLAAMQEDFKKANPFASYSEDLGGGVTMKMIAIKSGTFQMGSNDGSSDEKPVHEVTLDNYWLGETEVTQAQYEAIMGTNPSNFKGANNPVDQVSWENAMEFCRKLSQKTGKKYSLPTEAQWEYACRAGSSAKYGFGDSESELGDYAWYSSNSGSQTHPVRQKKPNAWGLYDMHGNVWEWCSDWYADSYSSSAITNPVGANQGSARVYRGGGWGLNADDCRSANRFRIDPTSTDSILGFRVVCFPS